MADPIIQLRYNQTTQVLEGNSGSAGWQALVLSESGSLSLTNTHIFVGNGSNLATDVALSGDATISNAGALTIAAGAVTASKIATGTITNTQINASAAIAYSKLVLTGSVVNADIASAAAIAVNKLAALTASTAVASDGSGFLVSSSTTAAELGFVHGVTSAIQTQINTKSPIANIVSGLASTWTTPSAAGGVTGLYITVDANLTLNGPTSPTDGQKIIMRFANDGSHTVTPATTAGNFDLGSLTYTPVASKTDCLGAVYDSTIGKWLVVAIATGY